MSVITENLLQMGRWMSRSSRLAATSKSRQAKLQTAIDAGFPSDLVEPFRAVISGRLPPDAARARDAVEERRKQMLARQDDIAFVTKRIPVHRVGKILSVSPEWGAFLYLTAKATQAKTILELGTAGGISGSYLAQAPACRRFIGVDVAAEALALARDNLEACAPGRFELINGYFDDVLDSLFEDPDLHFDLAWLDGHHEKQATFHYLTRVIPRLQPGSVVIYDDIRWSDDMFECWQTLRDWPGFAHTIDAGRLGVGIWSGDAGRAPRSWDLSRACSPGLAMKFKAKAA